MPYRERAQKLAHDRAYNLAHRDERRIYFREHYYKNADAIRAANREYQKRPEVKARQNELFRSRDRFRKYGLTRDMFDEYLDAQEGCCAFCGRPLPKTKRVAIDHDHQTGVFRGIVHIECNMFIGIAETDDRFISYMAAAGSLPPEILQGAGPDLSRAPFKPREIMFG